jgi:trehalose synthase
MVNEQRTPIGHNGGMFEPKDVQVPPLDMMRLSPLIGPERLDHLVRAVAETREALGKATVWNVSSTEIGGGVAEMLHILVGYAKGSAIDTRWVVVQGDGEFFQITKRLHNRLHGAAGDKGELGRFEGEHYRSVTDANALALVERVRSGDVVVLHDPQTAGLAGELARRGVRVMWRCHIGTERSNAFTEEAWSFLAPYLQTCRAFVFSHQDFVPLRLAGADVWIIPPSIDPYTPKNRTLTRAKSTMLLARIGFVGGSSTKTASDGAADPVVIGGSGPMEPVDQLVVQVSRWDRLKDMQGVLEGFAGRLAGRAGLHLALVGPAVGAVSDDPEGEEVLEECVSAWEGLSALQRRAIRLVTLPMADMEENALMVNVVQRHASVVVQKSIEEGFGLTVAEAMWKSRPVVASAVGGIVQQVAPGTGLLLEDPKDLGVFGDTLAGLLERPQDMARMGRRARRHIRANFLSDRHLLAFAHLVDHVARS